jgi:ribosome-associated toxin RatA of RatAB toxin-antitoxin module
MRLIKMFLFVILGLMVVLTIIGLLIPSSVKISRGVMIDADSVTVYNMINDVNTWKNWYPWITTDSGVLVQISPQTTGRGSFFKWTSFNKKSAGTITVTMVKPQLIGLHYDIKELNPADGGFRIMTVNTDNKQTQVQWFMEYKLKWYPWERFYGIFIDYMIGPVFDQGLQNLKTLVEKRNI